MEVGFMFLGIVLKFYHALYRIIKGSLEVGLAFLHPLQGRLKIQLLFQIQWHIMVHKLATGVDLVFSLIILP